MQQSIIIDHSPATSRPLVSEFPFFLPIIYRSASNDFTVLYYKLEAPLFLRPQLAPHTDHSLLYHVFGAQIFIQP